MSHSAGNFPEKKNNLSTVTDNMNASTRVRMDRKATVFINLELDGVSKGKGGN